MSHFSFFWADETIEHLADHGLTTEDFEYVVSNPEDVDISRSSGLLAAFGYTADGRYIIVVFNLIDETTIEPVTAYEVPQPGNR
jgi:hypothetical protein